MASKGACGNCGRKDRPVSRCKPLLCWTCQRAAQGLRGEERIKALVDIKETICGASVKIIHVDPTEKIPKVEAETIKKPKKGAIAAGSCGDETGKVEEIKTLLRGTFVDFGSQEDIELIEKIEAIAKAERRTPSAQILYFLEREIKYLDQELAGK